MTDVVLFHSALGVRPGTRRDADRMRAAGHTVHLPDLYEGRTFTDADEGVAFADQLGWRELVARAEAAVAGLPSGLVTVGMSMGAGLAEQVVTTRPGSRGALMCFAGHASKRPWPAGVPVQVHHSVDDRCTAELGATSALVAKVARAGGSASLHLYPGARHLFTHDDLPEDYDAGHAELLWRRALAFLDATDCLGATDATDTTDALGAAGTGGPGR